MFGPALLLCLLPPEPAVTVARTNGPPLTGRVAVVGGGRRRAAGDPGRRPARDLRRAGAGAGRPAGPFVPLTASRLGETLLAELGPGATLTLTPHYAIASTASREATGRAADLLEAVQAGFRATFGGDDPLPRPPCDAAGPHPLKDRAAFEAHVARPESPYGEVPAGSRGFLRPRSRTASCCSSRGDAPPAPPTSARSPTRRSTSSPTTAACTRGWRTTRCGSPRASRCSGSRRTPAGRTGGRASAGGTWSAPREFEPISRGAREGPDPLEQLRDANPAPNPLEAGGPCGRSRTDALAEDFLEPVPALRRHRRSR